MFKSLYAWTLLRPGFVILKREIFSRCPHLSSIAPTILADEPLHWWFGEHAVAAAIHAQRGVDQGCPFSPALFATLIAGALERVRAGLRLLDESAPASASWTSPPPCCRTSMISRPWSPLSTRGVP